MKTIINVSKSTGNGRSRHFFDIPMEGHHPDSVDFQAVYLSIVENYREPMYKIEVEYEETHKKLINIDEDGRVK